VVGRQRQVFIGSPYFGYGSNWYLSAYSAFPYVSSSESYEVSPSQSQIQDLANQVERLTTEVEQLRQDQAELRSQLSQAAAPPRQQPPEAPTSPITLVFRNGRRLSIQNYAIVRGSLWALEEFMSTRIPLTDLDIEATRQANPGRTLLLP
jgi:TolA-binding protein